MKEVDGVIAMLCALNAANVSFMLVGTFSSNAYGIERSTKNVDFVLQPGSTSVDELLEFLPKSFSLESRDGAETMSPTTPHRLHCEDLELPFVFKIFGLSDDAHDQLRFGQRVSVALKGTTVYLPRPEDVVITKLRLSNAGRRWQDVDDAKGVLAVQQGKLDLAYIRKWCDQHGTRELFEETLRSIPKLPDNAE